MTLSLKNSPEKKEPSFLDTLKNLFSNNSSEDEKSDTSDCKVYNNAIKWLNLSESSTPTQSELILAYEKKMRLYNGRIKSLEGLNSKPLVKKFKSLATKTHIAYKTVFNTINQERA